MLQHVKQNNILLFTNSSKLTLSFICLSLIEDDGFFSQTQNKSCKQLKYKENAIRIYLVVCLNKHNLFKPVLRSYHENYELKTQDINGGNVCAAHFQTATLTSPTVDTFSSLSPLFKYSVYL